VKAPSTEVVTLRGGDALAYLDGQCTQDLSALDVGASALTCVLDPAGTVVAVARVSRDATDEVRLETPVGTGANLRTRLERFALRTEVVFLGPSAPPDDSTPWFSGEVERVVQCVPGVNELAKGLVVHGLAEAVRSAAVSFTKGCYPGQELVARMQSRGAAPPWALRVCTLSGEAAVGDQLGDAERPGELTSVAYDEHATTWRALCVLHRRDASSSSLEVVSSPGVVARFDDEPSLRS
jgi:tRNA-modifying protein YgfZ